MDLIIRVIGKTTLKTMNIIKSANTTADRAGGILQPFPPGCGVHTARRKIPRVAQTMFLIRIPHR